MKIMYLNILLATFIGLVLTGCSGNEQVELVATVPANNATPLTTPAFKQKTSSTETPIFDTADKSNQIVLGAVLANVDTFFETVGQGMKAAAEEEGVEILFGSANMNEADENKVVEDYLARQVDIIILSPIDEKMVSVPLKTAIANGIKVVCFNGCFRNKAFEEAQVWGWYSTNQGQLGSETAKIIPEWMARQGLDKLYVGWVGCDSGCRPRSQGFFETLDNLEVNWELVDGQGDFNEASETIGVVETLIQTHPEINVIFAENEGTTIGAVQAVERQGKAGKVFVFGTDISPQIAQMLLAKNNILQAVTAQSPYQMGYLAVKAAVDFANGGEKQDINFVPVENLRRDEPEKVNQYLAR